MCTVRKPKPVQPQEKELAPLRNPYLDGIDPIVRARQTGTSALRIDRGSSRPDTAARPQPTTPPTYGDDKSWMTDKQKKQLAFGEWMVGGGSAMGKALGNVLIKKANTRS